MYYKAIVLAAALVALGPAAAGAAVSDVLVQPRWPWDTKVDIHFVLSGVDGPVNVTPTIEANGRVVELAPGSVTGSEELLNGAHRLVWDTSACGTEPLKDVRVSLGVSAYPLYMLVNLDSGLGNTSERISYTNRVVGTGMQWDDLYKSQYIVLRRVKAGSFLMGAGTGHTRQTTLTRDFYLGVYEMTQKQWKLCGEAYPYKETDGYSFHRSADADLRPVSRIGYGNVRGDENGWSGAKTLADNRNSVSGGLLGKIRTLTGGKHLFDLPTEAQWEYAARAGSTTVLPDGRSPSATELARIARHGNKADASVSDPNDWTSEYGTAVVGSYAPNDWGFFDMIGNAAEWCLDWSNGEIDGNELSGQTVDPMGAETSSDAARKFRLCRGGNWSHAWTSSYLTCSGRAPVKGNAGYRSEGTNYIGMRLCLTVEPDSILE